MTTPAIAKTNTIINAFRFENFVNICIAIPNKINSHTLNGLITFFILSVKVGSGFIKPTISLVKIIYIDNKTAYIKPGIFVYKIKEKTFLYFILWIYVNILDT